MPSQPNRADGQHQLCHPRDAATISDLESEMISLAHDAGLLSEPIDSLDPQIVEQECETLRSELAQLEVQLAGADEELKADLQTEIRLTQEALLVTEIAQMSARQFAAVP